MRRRFVSVVLTVMGSLWLQAPLALAHGGADSEVDITRPALLSVLLGVAGFLVMAWDEVVPGLAEVIRGGPVVPRGDGPRNGRESERE
ncbi:hypothetical protein [Caldinitratiruptor microaerophilus]|uniref:Holin n=1 Tax=Caldinitratiruptor microaerophilus TaxID=671077 RepID=A0AA35CL33_9FIRM|nr:hypothetical protein [Caldinitratiruptor microaerophilus]BDG60504.1 hypothetical protein caldi_15940 [Caldinitratiruptor microaerophilus]